METLSDKIAVVTGAGGGIGRAIARILGTMGATVCLVGRTRLKLEETARAIPPVARTFIFSADLTVDEQMDQLRESLQRQFERIDVLVLSAGIFIQGAVKDASLDDYDALYRINVRAPFRLVQILLPMLKKYRGQISVINSSAGINTPANMSQYSSTKHALKAMTDCLRNEVNPDGIRVLSVYCGRTATPLQEMLYARNGKEYRPELLVQPEDIASIVANALTLPRTAEVTDISIRPLLKSY